MPEKLYRIRPLVWKWNRDSECWYAVNCVVGTYMCFLFPGDRWTTSVDAVKYSSAEAAQKAAESHYRSRLAEALEEMQSTETTKPKEPAQ